MGDPLAGRVAIVTGAGMGLGKGIARRFAREGASVVIAELRAERGERTADEIGRELGGKARSVSIDVSHRDQVQCMVDETVETDGRPTGVEASGVAVKPRLARPEH